MTNEKKLIKFIKDTIKDTEFENHVFLIGGIVRDEIMNISSKDIDLVIDLKDGGIKFAEWITKKTGCFKENSNPVIFETFGTAKFNFRGYDFANIDVECVMTRSESYEKNSRKPKVEFSSLKEDVFRRDLTINSLLKNVSTGEILDLTGHGIIDIKLGLIKTPLDPDITFKDDPLRMLRVIRFAAKYDFEIDIDTYCGIEKNVEMIKTISSERVQEELNKILLTDKTIEAFEILKNTRLLEFIIPELLELKGLQQNNKYHAWDTWTHTLKTVNNTPKNLVYRWSALLHDIGKPNVATFNETGFHHYGHEEQSAIIAENILRRLKFSNNFIDAIVTIVANHMALKPHKGKVTPKSFRKFRTKTGEWTDATLILMQADLSSHGTEFDNHNFLKDMEEIIKETNFIPKKPNLPINGNDIMIEFDIPTSPEVGEMLKIVEEAWFENPNITKDEALKIVRENK